MRRVPARLPVALAVLVAVVAAGCGASSLPDREAEAGAAPTTGAATTDAVVTLLSANTETAPPGDNAGAWAAVDAGAQEFAAELDRATQSVASCETDAAAGADFTACAGRAYGDIVTAATKLGGVIDGASLGASGDCRAALDTMRSATQTLADDYTNAVTTTDWTSLDTLRATLADDAQAYADTALAAASSCVA